MELVACVGVPSQEKPLEAVIAIQVSDDPDRPQMVFAPKMDDLLHDFRRRLVGMTMRNGPGIGQAGFTSVCGLDDRQYLRQGRPDTAAQAATAHTAAWARCGARARPNGKAIASSSARCWPQNLSG